MNKKDDKYNCRCHDCLTSLSFRHCPKKELATSRQSLYMHLKIFVDNLSGVAIEGNRIKADPHKIEELRHAFANLKAATAIIDRKKDVDNAAPQKNERKETP